MGWSLPTRVSILLFVFLMCCVIGYYVAAYFGGEQGLFAPKLEPRFILSWLLLILAMPVAAYFAVRAWLETEPSQFPDIDEAWELGLDALSQKGVAIDQCPLFLVTGIFAPHDADNLMEAAEWELLVAGQPTGNHPLRWYASRDSIAVFLLDASAASMLQESVARELSNSARGPAQGGGLRGTLLGGAAPFPTTDTEAPATGIRGTIIADAGQLGPSAAPPPPATGIRGTMLAGYAEGQPGGAGASRPAATVSLDRQQVSDQGDRLARVCRLAAQARQPLCPFNGSLVVIDWNALLALPEGRLSAVVREDAARMIEASQLHAPTAVFVAGLDSEIGFIEMVRRVGEERARENRFGHGYNHEAQLEPEQLKALGLQACGAFEDLVYDLFRHPDALARSNNEKLYAFLCKVRSDIQPKIIDLLVSFSGTLTASGDRGALLCGCYFGAAGGTRMRHAFVRSVFDKLLQSEEDLEWSADAWQREVSMQNAVRAILFVNALLIVAIVSLLVYFFFFKA